MLDWRPPGAKGASGVESVDEKEQEKDEVFSELILKGCLVVKLTPNQILEKLADNLRAKGLAYRRPITGWAGC